MVITNKAQPNTTAAFTKKPSLKLNAISNWGPLAVNFIVGFLLTPYLIAQLGKVHYGIWALIASLIGYYGLLRLGVGAGIMRYVPFYKGTNNPNAVSQVASTGMALLLVAASITLVISMLLAEPIARFYKAGPELASLVRIVGVVAALECPMRMLDACMRSNEHWVPANLAAAAIAIFRAVGLAGCVYLGYGLLGMGYVLVGVTTLSLILTFILFSKFCKTIRIRLTMVKFSHVRSILSIGILSVIIFTSINMCLNSHKMFIGKIMSLEAVTLYAVAVVVIQKTYYVIRSPFNVFAPRFAYLDGKKDYKQITRFFLLGTKFSSVFSSGTMLIVFIIGRTFIRLWVGEDFDGVHRALTILAIGCLVQTSQGLNIPLLVGLGRQKALASFAAAEFLLSIFLSITLTVKMGFEGAAIGFTIAVVIVEGLVCPWYISRLLDIDIVHDYFSNFTRPWLILVAFLLVANYVGAAEFISGWLPFILMVFILYGIYAVSIYLFGIDNEVRMKINNFCLSRWKKIKSLVSDSKDRSHY